MASSSEAFEKFEIWSRSKTPLKVTLIVGGKTEEILFVRIFCADTEASQVGILDPSVMHSAAALDLEDSTFSVEPTRVVATRNESDWIIFEES